MASEKPSSEFLKMDRRDFLLAAAGTSAAAMAPGSARAESPAQIAAEEPAQHNVVRLLQPQQNAHRNLMDFSGFWQFQLDPEDSGVNAGWFRGLPSPRTIAVPCSWNDLYNDAEDYMGPAWYLREAWVPGAWRGQRIFLYFGSVARLRQAMKRSSSTGRRRTSRRSEGCGLTAESGRPLMSPLWANTPRVFQQRSDLRPCGLPLKGWSNASEQTSSHEQPKADGATHHACELVSDKVSYN